MLLAATLFTIGISIYIYGFIKHGMPNEEALLREGELS
jgi:nitric oxide reductase subunit B